MIPEQKYKDRQFVSFFGLLGSVAEENKNQVSQFGIQEHTLEKWLSILVEEVGELAEAINKAEHPLDIYKEAIQSSTVALKIAEIASFIGEEIQQ